MSNLFAWVRTHLNFRAAVVACLLMLTVSGASQAGPGEDGSDQSADVRSSISRHYAQGGRENPILTSETTEDFAALAAVGSRANSKIRSGSAKPGSGSANSQSVRNDFWVYDANVELFNDDDFDGHYHGIDLLFDVDTIFAAAEIYAVVYLSLDYGPWNEYAVTEDFWIFGTSGDDVYVLVTELMSGYPTGNYDLLIEIFDAWDDSFLASFGPDETSALSFLPLEDYDRDEPIVVSPVIVVPVAVSHGGGGASSGWTIGFLLLMLLASAGRKIWRRRNDALIRIDAPAPCWNVRTNRRG